MTLILFLITLTIVLTAYRLGNQQEILGIGIVVFLIITLSQIYHMR